MKISWSLGAISVAAICTGVAFGFTGCGSEEDNTNANTTPDSGAKEEAGACLQIDTACVSDGDCCSGACEPTSKKCARIAGKCTAAGTTPTATPSETRNGNDCTERP